MKVRNVASLEEFVDVHVRFATLEGWTLGKHDAPTFFPIDPKGYFVGELDGKPVWSALRRARFVRCSLADMPCSCVAGVKYSDDYAFVGYYLCLKEERGKGSA